MKNLSYQELANCQHYAEQVVDFWRCGHGITPMYVDDAEKVVREYNRCINSFRKLYGVSIMDYIQTIVECIGLIVEQ